ncbi:MAG: SnoaL-like domain-containing protein [Erythrobacter sp.]|nr:SnoaL-like domain-containing protein [Erythrobacter sp.]
MKNFRFLGACSAAALLMAATPGDSIAQPADSKGEHTHEMHSPGAVLTAYRDALVALDLEAAGVNFAEDSSIFENGKPEGNWDNYAAQHLGPELGHFHSFTFPAYDVDLRQDGHYAFGEERYTYRIELHDGRIVEREGVATSVLRHGDGGWKIIVYHSSGRPPKRS